MKTNSIVTLAVLIVAGGLAQHMMQDIAPGGVAPAHSHPGEEIVYAIEGLMESHSY